MLTAVLHIYVFTASSTPTTFRPIFPALQHYTFANPWYFLILLGTLPLFFIRGKSGTRTTLYFSSLSILGSLGKRPKEVVGGFRFPLIFIPLLLFSIALARPQWSKTYVQHQQSGIDIVVAIDVSRSMVDIRDCIIDGQRETRLLAARELSKGFINKRPHDRIGIVAFAGQPYSVSPITNAHDWLPSLIDSEVVFNKEVTPGTAVGSAIGFSSTLLTNDTKDSDSKVIILITDGSSNLGLLRPEQAAELARDLNVKIYTLAIGSESGRIQSGNFPSPTQEFDTETLKRVAEITEGEFYRAQTTESIEKAFDSIDQLEKKESPVNTFRDIKEYHHYFTLAGAGLLTLMLIAQFQHRIKIF